ncbi:phosphorylase [Terrihabitans sp. B22-R8]|uniref:phosphorylase n=1 Tax=Terrihabitans sp. B22-R8 TaxID=3425128 RepID=UPI00403D31B1
MSPSACDLSDKAQPVLVITGIAREARIAAGASVETVCSGGVPSRLREILAERGSPNCRAVVSFGVAGGLDPSLKPGDVVLGTKIVTGSSEWSCDAELLAALQNALSGDPRLKIVHAPLVGADFAFADVATKQAAFRESGAAAVDMESHIAAEYARQNKLPFAAIRVVCDPASRALPPLVTSALKPDGGISLPAVFKSLARRPEQILDLFHLSRDAAAAFRALGFVPAIGSQLLHKQS